MRKQREVSEVKNIEKKREIERKRERERGRKEIERQKKCKKVAKKSRMKLFKRQMSIYSTYLDHTHQFDSARPIDTMNMMVDLYGSETITTYAYHQLMFSEFEIL